MERYPPFRTVDISFSNRCALRCAHCMFAADMTYEGPTIGVDLAKRIVDEAAAMETFTLLAAGAQEVFLDYAAFLEVAGYARTEYGAELTISTSCYWVKGTTHAQTVFGELQQRGLTAVLVSVDQYHLEFVPLAKVRSALEALRRLGIATTVQTIRGKGDPHVGDYRVQLGEVAQGDWATFCELPAAPVGRGATLSDAALDIEPGIPSGGCNVFDVLHIEPDGSVKPCCGAGLTAAGLTMGNVRRESLPAIAERMQADPLLNSLRAWRGPAQLFEEAARLGMNGFQKPGYAGTCHACFDLFTREEVVAALRRELSKKAVEYLAARWFAERSTTTAACDH